MVASLSNLAGYLLLFTLFCSVFFTGSINTYQLLAGISILTLTLMMVCRKKISYKKLNVNRSIVIFIGAIFITFLTSVNRGESIKYLLIWLTVFFEVLVVKSGSKYKKKIYNAFFFFCMIECFSITFQYMFPEKSISFFSIILSNQTITNMMDAYSLHNACTGLAGSQPFAMFYAYCLFSMGILRCLKKFNVINIFVVVFSCVNLLLSGKRSAIVITVIALLYVGLFIFQKNREVSRKWKIILIVLITVGGYLLLNTSIGSSLLEKNRTLIDNGDISNGRFFLFEEMFKIFVSRPITGIGPLSTFSYYNDYLGHNVYLQVLCEMGVIGFIALLYMLISGLKYRINVLKRKNATDFDFLALFIQLFIIIYGFFGNPIFSYVFIIPYILFSAD